MASVWGIASAIGIYNGTPEAIRRLVVELCDPIKIKRFGLTQVMHCGADEKVAGDSMTQIIDALPNFSPLCKPHHLRLSRCVQLQTVPTESDGLP